MKRLIPLILIFALFTSLASCRNDARAEIENELESARAENEAKIQTAEEASESSKFTAENEGTGQAAATPEKHGPATDWDGILSSEYTLMENKFYFECKAVKKGNTMSMPTSYDLVTGECSGLCPDPLCRHDDTAVCKYISVNSSTNVVFADDSTLFWTRTINGEIGIYRYDLSADTVRLVYEETVGEPYLVGEDGGIVYFTEFSQERENGRVVTSMKLKGIDVKTDKIVCEMPMNEERILFIRDGVMWADAVRAIETTDLATGEKTTIAELDNAIGSWYYDTKDGSLWFNTFDQQQLKGSLWMWKGGKLEQVNLPAEEIYYFQLTNSEIIYSGFEPTYYGKNPTSIGETWDYAGGKIHAVDRRRPDGDARLLYDADGKYVMVIATVSGYVVFGDRLLFRKITVTTESMPVWDKPGEWEEYTFFDMSGNLPTVCIDLATGEETVLSFEGDSD